MNIFLSIFIVVVLVVNIVLNVFMVKMFKKRIAEHLETIKERGDIIYHQQSLINDYVKEIERYRQVEINQNYDDLRTRYGYLKDACKNLQRQIRDSSYGRGVCPKVIIKGPTTSEVIHPDE